MDTAASVVSHHTDATPECIYLDYNATTPIFPEVSEAMVPYITSRFGNPSSLHALGQTSEGAVRVAREQIAHLIGAEASEIYFTSCGTESNNWAIWGAVMQRRAHQPQGPPPHVVTTAVEHPAVLKPLESWAGLGLLRYSVVGVDAEGRVDPDAVAAAMDPEGGTCLVSVMHSNNEVGTLQPIAEVSRQAKAYGALMHTDAAQSVGKLAVDVRKLGVDLLTLVGHKFGAPKGVAALFVRKGVGPLPSLLHGGGQEAGARSGTENVPHIVALGAAAVVAATELPVVAQKMARQRSLLLQLIAEGVGVGGGGGGEDAAAAVKVHGPADAQLRLPNTLSVCCPGTSAAAVLQQLSAQVAMSAGSACHSGDPGRTRPSPVLSAMGVAESDAAATLRLSVGRGTTDLEIHRAAALISAALRAHLMLSRG